ncbi:MAG: hypothetical protein ACYTGX_01430 [Planctomycetota bacterium]|jgi:hypothetical protein
MPRLLHRLRRSAAAAALVAGLAASAHAQVPDIDPIDGPAPRTDARLLVRRPLRIGHNGGFQSLVFTPPFESAEILPGGAAFLASHYQASRTSLRRQGANVYRGTLHSLDFSGALGINDLGGPVEAKIDVSLAQLSAARHDVGATFEGAPVVRSDWSSAMRLRRAAFGLKIGIYDGRSPDLAVSTTGWAKVPIDGDDNLTDTGELELGAVIALTHGMRVPAGAAAPSLYLHAQIGAMWRQNQDLFDTRVRPNSSAVWAFGAVVLLGDLPAALVAQAEGSANPFNELDDFNSDPATFSAGLRFWSEPEAGDDRAWYHGVMLELAVSFGLADRNGVETALTAGLGYHF